MAPKTLDELFAEDDPLGLLDVKPFASNSSTEQSRIAHGFEELSVFFDRHHFAPGQGPAETKPTVAERTLQMRLKAYRDDPTIVQMLSPLDRHGLLSSSEPPEKVATNLDEILASGDELLNASGEEIFTLRYARPAAARPDKISERQPCRDFFRFKPLFDLCVRELAAGVRSSLPFANEQEIDAGEFFILNGVMVYVAEVNDPHIRNGKRNARLRLIFENGTEGQNLLRSLATELYKDPSGRRITNPSSGPLFASEPTNEYVAAPKDRATGCIYVVKSLSPLPDIAKLDGNLFKIGFTTGRFEDRIRGAKDDPTFLMAPVQPVRTYDAVNLNANKFEKLMHLFFAAACLDIEIKDRFGRPFKPREWFLLPLPVIEQAIRLLIDGSIIRHRYDPSTASIIALGE